MASLLAFEAVAPPPCASDLFVAPRESLTVASIVSEAIDHFVFTPPPIFFAPSATPPDLAYAHLAVADIRRLLNVPEGAETGQGVRVAIVDTGFYPHPYYAANGFAVRSVLPAGESDVDKDAYGHGTAVPLNLLAVAPRADLVVVKNSRGQADVAIEKAVDEGARILSCSWGWNYEQMFPILEATIRSVIADDGVIVLFAAGNGQYAWPGSMPEVISVGGVYADPANAFALEASSYASGFMSGLYPPRRVPDLSGLCGQAPRGIYIPMPCPPGSEIDSIFGGAGFPEGDGTAKNDGWVVASGTSSATPQVAGIVALMLERALAGGRALSTAAARTALEQTARAVNAGRNAMGFPAVGQPNVACGFGLVDAAAAIARV